MYLSIRIQVADPEYKKAFDDELVAFKKRIRKRAEEKIAEYEREERLGPGGLDPLEVMESLPKVRQLRQKTKCQIAGLMILFGYRSFKIASSLRMWVSFSGQSPTCHRPKLATT